MATLTYDVSPTLLGRRSAAVALDTSEKRIHELVEYADSLPTERR